MVRYYGYYSNVSRGKRQKEGIEMCPKMPSCRVNRPKGEQIYED